MTKAPPLELDLSGRCDCGAVIVQARGRVLSMFQCGCTHCQVTSGSGHASVVLFPADSVDITGETQSYSRPADSGATFTRHFCPRCATTVCAQSSRAAGIRIVPVGLFAGQNDWFAPRQLIFGSAHPEWDRIADALPRYAAYKPEASQ